MVKALSKSGELIDLGSKADIVENQELGMLTEEKK